MSPLRTYIFIIIFIFASAVAWRGFRVGRYVKKAALDYYTLRYNPAVFENKDSLLFYAQKAYIDDDRNALAITGTAAYVFYNDSAAHDTLPIVPLDEADIMLLHACELGSDSAAWIIECLYNQGFWRRSLPKQLEK